MLYSINDECISCGACTAECPVATFQKTPQNYIIDPDIYVDCGTCANVCPVNAPKA